MIKLLIVDDEQIEREGMQLIIERNFPQVIVKQAHNGQIAVQRVEEFKPDLVLMDIKMPGMNGLEAIEQITTRQEAVKFIMVTAYDTFAYMRQAIKFGVKDYLLKPSKASDIVATIGRVITEIEKEKAEVVRRIEEQAAFQKTLSLVETDIVTQLLFDHVHEVHVDILLEMMDMTLPQEAFVMMVVLPQATEHEYASIKNVVRSQKCGWVGAMYGKQLPIIVLRNRKQSFHAQAKSMVSELHALANRHKQSNWFIGIGNVSSSLEYVRQSYQESLIATLDTIGSNRYRFYSDVPVLSAEETPHWTMIHHRNEFSDRVRLGEWDQVLTDVLHVIQYYESKALDLLYSQQCLLEVLWIISRVMKEIGVDTATPMFAYHPKDYRQLRTDTCQLINGMRKDYERYYNELETDMIQQIKQYIMMHSNEDITLESLAKKVNLSPIYISKMFKEKLGINYIDLLTDCRIDKAKKMLADPEKSIKEITYEVGYHDPNYFSKVFKKVCQMTPKEYRKSLASKGRVV